MLTDSAPPPPRSFGVKSSSCVIRQGVGNASRQSACGLWLATPAALTRKREGGDMPGFRGCSPDRESLASRSNAALSQVCQRPGQGSARLRCLVRYAVARSRCARSHLRRCSATPHRCHGPFPHCWAAVHILEAGAVRAGSLATGAGAGVPPARRRGRKAAALHQDHGPVICVWHVPA